MSNDMDASSGKAPLYLVEHAQKIVESPAGELTILRDVNFEVRAGEALAVVGSSGCGKSTLLHILGTLDRATGGRVLFDGRDLSALTPREAAHFRNRELGFVFQFHHLLPEFTTVENVAMQAFIAGMPRSKALSLAAEALEKVGLGERLNHHVATLSGGERQRAAIARATLLRPRVLLADEPTGNLDEKTGARVTELLRQLNRDTGMTLIIVTHNRELAENMDRSLELRSGELYAQHSF
ncbi:ABC transporter ATP-binding protein [Mailhella massiliensis]|uniref:ABC transporter ATP-binding protein n=1 Tax=Mailhella massiliensis TaxID=1903261 RepID=A0A921DRR8_9BACT|nr:ABC transporter ATP-binding protein [Mailhella massiliensis]HJD97894.1 ABC transporter ATP-binding protein [Mailhella massiliensis]